MADQPSGREFARLMLTGLREFVGRAFALLREDIDEVRQAIQQTPTMEMVRGEVAFHLGQFQAPEGKQGEPGKAITFDDVRPMIELAAREAALQAYRDGRADIQRAVDQIPKPKDGADGASIEDFDIAMDGRRLIIGMRIGGKDITREFRLDIPQDAGVYRTGQVYEKSDIVTFGGSTFIAQCNGPKGKPEESRDWRLMVKRGRDGKDAIEGGEE